VASLDEIADLPRKAIGLDMGGAFDLAAVVFIGADHDGIIHVQQHSWVSRSGFETFRSKAPLQQFIDRGELTIEGEDAVSSELIASELMDYANAIGVTELAVDPSMLTVIGPMLEADGIELREARQGTISMTPAMHFAEERISAGELRIGDDALLKWAMGNTGVVSNSTGRRPCKIGNDSNVNPKKIEPISAMLTGLQLINEQRFGEGSAYVKRDAVDYICPYTDPINAIAVIEGGTAVALSILSDPVDPTTGAWVVA
jgi:phage terminase large subunit-like protein